MGFPGLNDKAFEIGIPSQQTNNHYQFDNTQKLAAKLGEQLQVIHDRQNPTWQEGIQRQFDNIETTLNSSQVDEPRKAQLQLIKRQLIDRLSTIYNWLIDHRPQHQNITTKHQQIVNKLQEQLTKCVDGFVESAESVMDFLYTPTTLEEILCKTRTQLLNEFIQRNIARYTSLIGHEIHNSQYIQNIAYYHYGTQYSQNYARTYFNTDDTTIRSDLQSFFESNYQLHHLVDYIINSIHTQAQQHYGDNYQAEYFNKDQVYLEDRHNYFINSITNVSNIQSPCNIFDFHFNEDVNPEIAGINWAYIRYAIWNKLIQDQFIDPEPDYTNLNNPQERDKAIYYLISLAKMHHAFSQQQLANKPEEVVSQAKTNINQALQKVESNLGDQLESWLADALKTVMNGDLDRGFPAVFQLMQDKNCSPAKYLASYVQAKDGQWQKYKKHKFLETVLDNMSQKTDPKQFCLSLVERTDPNNPNNSQTLMSMCEKHSYSNPVKFICRVMSHVDDLNHFLDQLYNQVSLSNFERLIRNALQHSAENFDMQPLFEQLLSKFIRHQLKHQRKYIEDQIIEDLVKYVKGIETNKHNVLETILNKLSQEIPPEKFCSCLLIRLAANPAHSLINEYHGPLPTNAGGLVCQAMSQMNNLNDFLQSLLFTARREDVTKLISIALQHCVEKTDTQLSFEQILSATPSKLYQNNAIYKISIANIKNTKTDLDNILRTIFPHIDNEVQKWLLNNDSSEPHKRPKSRIAIIVNKFGDIEPEYVLNLIDQYQLFSDNVAFQFYYNQRSQQLTDYLDDIIQNQGIKAFLPHRYQASNFLNECDQKQLLRSIMKKQDVDTFDNNGETSFIYLKNKLIDYHQNLPLEYDDKVTLLKWVCVNDEKHLYYIVDNLSQQNPEIVADIIFGNILTQKRLYDYNSIKNCLKDIDAFEKLLNYAQEQSYDILRQTLIKNIDAFTLQTLLSNKPQHRLIYNALTQQGNELKHTLSKLSVTNFTNNELQLFLNALFNHQNAKLQGYRNYGKDELTAFIANEFSRQDAELQKWLEGEPGNPSHFIQDVLQKPDIQLDQLNSKALDIITKKEVREEHYKTILGKGRFELARSLFDTELCKLSKEHRHFPEEYRFHKRKKIEDLLKLETYNKQKCHKFFSHLINQLDPIDKHWVLNEVWANAIGADSNYPHFLELAIIAWSPGDSTEFIKRLIEGSPVIANEHMSGKHYTNVDINHILQTQYIQAILQQDHNLAKLLQNSQHLQNGETPLTEAIKNDDLGQAKRILHKGACINQRNKDNEFPLHIAIKNKQTELVSYLIQQGADVVTPKTNMGNVARTANNPQDLTKDETIRKLVEDNQPNETGHTKLSKAIMKEDSDTINDQLQQGANVNHLIYEDGKQDSPKTPLYYALSNNRLDIAQQLLQKGARLQITTDKSDGRFNVPYKDYSHKHPEYLFGHLNLLKQSHEIREHAKFQNLNLYIENHIENLLDMISEDIADEGDSKCIDQFTHKQWCKDDRDNYWEILHSTNDRVERYKRLPISNMQQWLRDNAYIQQDNQPIDFSQLLVDLKATLQSEMEHLSDSQQQKLQQLETMSTQQNLTMY